VGRRHTAVAGWPYGVTVEIRLEQRTGPGHRAVRHWRAGQFFRRPAQRPIGRLLSRVSDVQLARRLAALGHPKRVAIVKAILAGASTHKELSRAVTIKTGPLYFHLRALEREGLLRIEERQRYEASEECRQFVLIVATA